MAKIILDRGGDLKKSVFYEFDIPFDDEPDEKPKADWIVVPRTPTDDDLRKRSLEPWIYVTLLPETEDLVVKYSCPADHDHRRQYLYRRISGEAFGGTRLSSIVPSSTDPILVLSDELRRALESLKVRGAMLTELDLREHNTGKKLKGFWAVQFTGKPALRIPKIVGGPNACPYCGLGPLLCETCGWLNARCQRCKNKQGTVIIETEHEGRDDKRIPFEEELNDILEGKLWDGSDLVQDRGRKLASKRFIDWLLRVHAAPFYARPISFCMDGMNDEQKKWFDEIQKPLGG
ncbi:MAG: hypothetical protein MUF06_22310 [Pirellulaceae bacterium]|nr:hypothetical protein [Pirellulaceae bacterium]